MALNDYLDKNVYPKINAAIKNPSFKNGLKTFFGKYLNKNRDKFSAIGPCENIFFTKEYQDYLFKLFGVTEAEVKECMKLSEHIKDSDAEQNVNPFNLMMSVAVKCLYDNKMTQERIMTSFLMYMSIFPSTYTKYFKYKPNKAIMEYTVNNMSIRFDIKKLGYFKTLQESAEGAYTNNIPMFEQKMKTKSKQSSDFMYCYYVLDSKNRLNSLLKNIRAEFEKAYQNQNFLNFTDEKTDDEDDYHVNESDSLKVRRIVQNTTTSFFAEMPNVNLIQYAAKIAGISVNVMKSTIFKLQNKLKREDVYKLIEAILNEYTIVEHNRLDDIHTNSFLVFSLKLYKKNSDDVSNIKTIKDALTTYLNTGTDIMNTTTRAATINNFKRGIYIYFVLMIQQKS